MFLTEWRAESEDSGTDLSHGHSPYSESSGPASRRSGRSLRRDPEGPGGTRETLSAPARVTQGSGTQRLTPAGLRAEPPKQSLHQETHGGGPRTFKDRQCLFNTEIRLTFGHLSPRAGSDAAEHQSVSLSDPIPC